LKVPTEQLAGMLGVTSVAVVKHPRALRLNDTAIA
jgi:biotin operon repressor